MSGSVYLGQRDALSAFCVFAAGLAGFVLVESALGILARLVMLRSALGILARLVMVGSALVLVVRPVLVKSALGILAGFVLVVSVCKVRRVGWWRTRVVYTSVPLTCFLFY